MNKSSVGRRYATALFNLLDDKSVDVVCDCLNTITQSLHTSLPFKQAIASPVFTFEEKKAILDDISDRTGAPPVLKLFFAQLLQKNRGNILPEISESFLDLVDEKKGLQHVCIISAKEMSSADQEQLQTDITTKLQQSVKLKFETNSSLIAGLQIRIGSHVFDNTVRGKLANMRTRLAKG